VALRVEGEVLISQPKSPLDIPQSQVLCLLPHIPVGGGLLLFREEWVQFPMGSVVKNIINEGYKITFLHGPPPFNG
jgi:hypothetical protein